MRNAVTDDFDLNGSNLNLVTFIIDILKGSEFKDDNLKTLTKKTISIIKPKIESILDQVWNNFINDALPIAAAAGIGLNSDTDAKILLGYDVKASDLLTLADTNELLLSNADLEKMFDLYFSNSTHLPETLAKALADLKFVHRLAKRSIDVHSKNMLKKMADYLESDNNFLNKEDDNGKTVLNLMISSNIRDDETIAYFFKKGAKFKANPTNEELGNFLTAIKSNENSKLLNAMKEVAKTPDLAGEVANWAVTNNDNTNFGQFIKPWIDNVISAARSLKLEYHNSAPEDFINKSKVVRNRWVADALLKAGTDNNKYINLIVESYLNETVYNELKRVLNLATPEVAESSVSYYSGLEINFPLNKLLKDNRLDTRLIQTISLFTKYKVDGGKLSAKDFDRYLVQMLSPPYDEQLAAIYRQVTTNRDQKLQAWRKWVVDNKEYTGFKALYLKLNDEQEKKKLKSQLVFLAIDKAIGNWNVNESHFLDLLELILRLPDGEKLFSKKDNADADNILTAILDSTKNYNFSQPLPNNLIKGTVSKLKPKVGSDKWNAFVSPEALPIAINILKSTLKAKLLLSYEMDVGEFAADLAKEAARPEKDFSSNDLKKLFDDFVKNYTNAPQLLAEKGFLFEIAKRKIDLNIINIFKKVIKPIKESHKKILRKVLELLSGQRPSGELSLNCNQIIKNLKSSGIFLEAPIFEAIEEKDLNELTRIIDETGLFLNIENHLKENPLEAAANKGDLDIIKVLLKNQMSQIEPVKSPILVDRMANIKTFDLSNVSRKDMDKALLVIFPSDHWFLKIFEENPFKNIENIIVSRPIIFNQELVRLGKLTEGIIYRKNPKELYRKYSHKTDFENYIKSKNIADLDYKNYFGELKKIGSGSQGQVFSFDFAGRSFAVKRSSGYSIFDEAAQLELSLFTDAVVPFYGLFTEKGQIFLIMQKGEHTLSNIISIKGKIDDEVYISSAQNMIRFCKVAGSDDIKPENMILTNEGIKHIDLGGGYTYGYEGNCGEKSAYSLIQAYAQTKITIYPEKISKGYEKYASQYMCEKDKLSNDCDIISGFDDLYKLYTDKYKYDTLTNHGGYPVYIKSGSGNDLIYPQFAKIKSNDDIDWNKYFSQSNNIGEKFCEEISDFLNIKKRSLNKRETDMIDLYNKYCYLPKDESEHTYFIGQFTTPDDEFKIFVLAIYDYQIFLNLHRVYLEEIKSSENLKNIIKFAIGKILSSAPGKLSDVIWQLYKTY